MNAPTIVQVVVINDTGDSCYRMRWPGQHLAEQSPGWRVINLDANAAERFEWSEKADLLVLYQSHDLDLLPLIKRRQQQGKKTLVEYNDNFYAPSPASPVSKEWSSPLLWQVYETFMNQSDGVIVTGPGLLQLLSQKTSTNIHILENYLPQQPPPFEKLWALKGDVMRIGWAGSLGHMSDLLAIRPLLKEILDLDPSIVLHLMGNVAIPDALGLPAARISFTPWGSMEQYFKFWEAVQIGLVPLIDTPYNRCRSDIKAVEISSRGAVPILTAALPYQAFSAKTGLPGLRSFADFRERIRHYLSKPEVLMAEAKRCHAYVCSERIGTKNLERLRLYQRMLPAQPQPFSWPLAPGYHEVRAKTPTPSTYSQVASEIREKIKAHNYSVAQALAVPAADKNPWSADLQLLKLRCLARVEPNSVIEQLQAVQRCFPEDLRFVLLEVGLKKEQAVLLKDWQEIVGRLQARCDNYRTAFAAEVVRLFCRQLQAAPALAPVGEALLEVYPESAELKFVMAFYYLRLEDHPRAQALLLELCQTRRDFQVNQDFLSKLDGGYIETWAAALHTQIKATF